MPKSCLWGWALAFAAGAGIAASSDVCGDSPATGKPKDVPKSVTKNVDKASVDLLKLVDPARHATHGVWRTAADGLMTDGKRGRRPAVLEIPYTPPKQFDLSGTFTASKQDTVAFGFPTTKGHAGVSFNGYGKQAGLWGGQTVDCPLTHGKKHRILIQVRGDSVVVFANGNRVFAARVTDPHMGEGKHADWVGIETHVGGTVTFHSLVLLPKVTGGTLQEPRTPTAPRGARPATRPASHAPTMRGEQNGTGTKPKGQDTSPAPKPVGSGKQMTPTELFAKASPAVVRVMTYNSEGKPLAHGSGFFISATGTVVTNHHVIEDAASISVVLTTNAKLPVLRVLASDAKSDLAVLATDAENVPFLRLADKNPAVGTKVYAIGNPLGFKNTFTSGDVSGFSEDKGTGTPLLQTSTPISRGSSGGPLLTLSGEVVGVTTFTMVRGQNLNFAVTQGVIKKLLAAPRLATSRPSSTTKRLAQGKHYASVAAILDAAPKELFPEKDAVWTSLQFQLFNKWLKENVDLHNRHKKMNWLSVSGRFSRGEVSGQLVGVWLHPEFIDEFTRVAVLGAIEKSSVLKISGLKQNDLIALNGVIIKVSLSHSGTRVVRRVRRQLIGVEVILGECSVSKIEKETKPKPTPKPKPIPRKPKTRTPEEQAKAKLSIARSYLQFNRKDQARKTFESIIKDYPDTASAKEAKAELERLK